jgi:putative toxin-antitoxin system antitoxin component (TIGR02293 family)
MARSVTERVAQLVGAKGVRSSLEFVPALRRGLRYSVLQRASDHVGIPVDAVTEALGLPKRTLARRKVEGVLSTTESERVLRFARVVERARDIIGEARAAAWLQRPNRALGGVAPLSLLDTDIGAQEVEDVLGRIEYGIYT